MSDKEKIKNHPSKPIDHRVTESGNRAFTEENRELTRLNSAREEIESRQNESLSQNFWVPRIESKGIKSKHTYKLTHNGKPPSAAFLSGVFPEIAHIT